MQSTLQVNADLKNMMSGLQFTGSSALAAIDRMEEKVLALEAEAESTAQVGCMLCFRPRFRSCPSFYTGYPVYWLAWCEEWRPGDCTGGPLLQSTGRKQGRKEDFQTIRSQVTLNRPKSWAAIHRLLTCLSALNHIACCAVEVDNSYLCSLLMRKTSSFWGLEQSGSVLLAQTSSSQNAKEQCLQLRLGQLKLQLALKILQTPK